MSKRKDAPVVNVDLAARAEAKLEVRATVPEKSTARLVDALTDLIRPFSEKRGLRADQIRLQREDVLIEIAKRARDRARNEELPLSPVPNKFLLPFLEKASLEESESELIARWADLLLSASQQYDASHVRYTSVLAEIGPLEVKLIKRLASGNRNNKFPTLLEDAGTVFASPWLSGRANELARSKLSPEEMNDYLCVDFEQPGALVLSFIVFEGNSHWEFGHADFSQDDDVSFSILESLGVVKKLTASSTHRGRDVYLDVVHLTEFGVGFYLACDFDAKKQIDSIRDDLMKELKSRKKGNSEDKE